MSKEDSYLNIIQHLREEIKQLNSSLRAIRSKNENLKDRAVLFKSNCEHWKSKYEEVFKKLSELETTISFNDVNKGEELINKFRQNCRCLDKCESFIKA